MISEQCALCDSYDYMIPVHNPNQRNCLHCGFVWNKAYFDYQKANEKLEALHKIIPERTLHETRMAAIKDKEIHKSSVVIGTYMGCKLTLTMEADPKEWEKHDGRKLL